MTVYNQTYNFNQGNMNFGQALLYGAFGSLTNMMGGCSSFGGFGSSMGMGSSLFSMMGGFGCGSFGSYGMGCSGFGGYSDSYYTTMAGMSVANVLMQGISGYFSSRKSEKAAENANAESVEKLQEEIEELQKQIDDPESYVSSTAKTELENADKNLQAANANSSDCDKTIKKLSQRKDDLEKKESLTAAEKVELELIKDETGTKEGSISYAVAQKTKAEGKVTEAKTAFEKAQKEFKDASFQVVTDAQTKIEAKKKEIEKLKNKSNGQAENALKPENKLTEKIEQNKVMTKFISLADKYKTAKLSNSPNLTTIADELNKAYKAVNDSGLSNNLKAMAKQKCDELGINLNS